MRRVLPLLVLAVLLVVSAFGCGSSRGGPRPEKSASPAPSCPSGPVTVDMRVTIRRGVRALAAGDGEVWVANPLAATVTRVDARSGRVDEPFGLGDPPTEIAVGSGGVWTIDRGSGRVLRVNPADRTVRELPGVGVPIAIEMTPSGPFVLSLDDGALYGFDGKGDRTTYDLSVPVVGAGAMAALGDELWVLGYEDKFLVPMNHKLRRIVRDATRLGMSSVAAMTAGGGFLWLADTVDRRMMRFEPRGRTPRNTVLPRSVRPVAMAVGRCGWTIDARGRIARFDPATGRFAGKPIRVARSGGEIVADSTGAWVTDPTAGQLLHVRVGTP